MRRLKAIALKGITKKLRLDPYQKLTPLKNMIHIGSRVHGYHIPADFITPSSICYCVGAGDDISFDTELVVTLGAKVFTFDPSPEGMEHFMKLKEMTGRGEKMTTGLSDPSFIYRINSEQLNQMTFIEIGMWDADTLVRFHKPSLQNYESHSIVLFQESTDYIELPVDRLSTLMKKLNHTTVDLLKLEIEGAEYTVLKTLVEDKPDVKMILVEFDEIFHSKGLAHLYRIKDCCKSLINAGYKIVHTTDKFKMTFVRNDVYQLLKSRENKN